MKLKLRIAARHADFDTRVVVQRDLQPWCQKRRAQLYLQLGSMISRFQVPWEIGSPVRIGYIQAKFVMTSAT
jgi:hypothetical protein